MSVYSQTLGNRTYFSGLSTDAKPTDTIQPGALFLETDTNIEYVLQSNKTWTKHSQAVALNDGNNNAIGSSGGALYSAMFIWQPTTLSYIHASADASGNLNTTVGGGGGGGTVNQGTGGASAWKVYLDSTTSLPTGSNTIGKVDQGIGGSLFPWNVSISPTSSLPYGNNYLGQVGTLSTDYVPGITAADYSQPVVITSDQTSANYTPALYNLATQNNKDASRINFQLFMLTRVAATATETLQSLTGYTASTSGSPAAGQITATTTPAVVPSGKIYYLQSVVITYVSLATVGSIKVNLRANSAGLVAIGSPIIQSWEVGSTAATVGAVTTMTFSIPNGLQVYAGTGIGITVQGFDATNAAAAAGYAKVSLIGMQA
jgi:hypothetical protein